MIRESKENLAPQIGSKEEREEKLKVPLRCSHLNCRKQFKNMVQLKDHLISNHN